MRPQGNAGGQGRSKRHHYLPESYLKLWADDHRQVAVRRRDQDQPFPASTINVSVESDLYTIPSESGLDDRLERELAEIESVLPAVLATLRDEPVPRRGSSERDHLSYLLALQQVRTPEHMDRLMFPLRAVEFTGEQPVSPAGMKRFLTDDYLREVPSDGELQGALDYTNFTLSQGLPTKEEILSTLFEVAHESVAPHIAGMAWAVERSTGSAFLTTDRPVAVWRRDPSNLDRMGTGLASADEVRFALGPDDLLVLRPSFPDRQRTVVGADRVRAVNQQMASQCYDMVISRKADSEILARVSLGRDRPVMRFNTGPAYATDAQGRTVKTDKKVLHMYASYGDEAPRVQPPGSMG
jgi:hypothetical protein